MKVEIKVPAMGESITEVTIGQVLKPAGSVVKMDEEIIELETDKVNQVLYAPQSGVVSFTVKTGDVVKVGDTIGTLEAGGAADAPQAKPVPKKVEEKQPPAPKQVPSTQQSQTPSRVGKEEFIQDLKQPAPPKPQSEKAKPKSSLPQPAAEGEESRRKMSKVRSVIAARLVEVQHVAAMLTTFNEVDLSAVMEIREKHQESFQKEHGVKLGLMSFFVKAAVSALKEFPDFNAYIDGDEIVQRHYYNIGVAVGTDRGLFVPVLRGCDHLTFEGIEQDIQRLAGKARDGTITVDDLQGGGFTITNGGVYGSMLSTPILNPMQCAILGMHKIMKRPVVVVDEIVIRPMMYLALSYDHRLVDGKAAVTFLVHIKNSLEDPANLLLEL